MQPRQLRWCNGVNIREDWTKKMKNFFCDDLFCILLFQARHEAFRSETFIFSTYVLDFKSENELSFPK